ncbi:hypothetical protein BKA56DRAFT_624697 [Ilyonectria sp. MPI-CAGE-AT-0026]|nr:hypothetical protein BKA56DRAFT_624697 [Ilyonectria sp. MPI-CAGE-AT-0026]
MDSDLPSPSVPTCEGCRFDPQMQILLNRYERFAGLNIPATQHDVLVRIRNREVDIHPLHFGHVSTDNTHASSLQLTQRKRMEQSSSNVAVASSSRLASAISSTSNHPGALTAPPGNQTFVLSYPPQLPMIRTIDEQFSPYIPRCPSSTWSIRNLGSQGWPNKEGYNLGCALPHGANV